MCTIAYKGGGGLILAIFVRTYNVDDLLLRKSFENIIFKKHCVKPYSTRYLICPVVEKCIIWSNYHNVRNKIIDKLRNFAKYLAKSFSIQNNSKSFSSALKKKKKCYHLQTVVIRRLRLWYSNLTSGM